MRHVILYSGGLPAPGLAEALRAAHCTTTVCLLPPAAAEAVEGCGHEDGAGEDAAPSPLAVVFDLAAGAELADLYAAAGLAAARWPGVPLVACRRGEPGATLGGAARFDDAVLKRLGFHAVAANPAQVAAVLRDVEDGGADDGTQDSAARADLAPASLLLPDGLGRVRLRAAFEVVASLHFAPDQEGAARAALAGLAALVRADRWAVYLAGGGGGAAGETLFEPLAVRGRPAAGAPSAAAREALRAAETLRRREAGRCVLAAPLAAGERIGGIIEAVREGAGARQFSASDASLLAALALPVSAALSNSARVAEAERLSQTDDLTRLHNARYLRQYLTGEMKRARRYGSEVTAIFLDLDDFKQVNDRHGHLVGSHVLMEMGSVILASVRDTDIVCRYGGDEFVVILPEAGIEQGLGVADRVRERVSRHHFTGGRNLSLRLTASFGVASFPEHAQSPQQLVARADAAMYRAKAGRKNCVRFAAEARADA
ncbi:MAG TPA: GGDEF domain-containing protein [Pyrinomonadaceae bacterium]|nr:GGDEF domain-containing protein [Pyrinomonadaceae bacterium]